jgi:malate synthase
MELTTTVSPGFNEVLTTEALQFIEKLEREFHARRLDLLRARVLRQEELDAGGVPDFLPATRHIRAGEWQVAPIPADLQNRRVEITGPTDRKMVINALNSGANVFMADFEDANSPTWNNMIEGHINLRDALERTIDFTSPDGKRYSLNERVRLLSFVRAAGISLKSTRWWTANRSPLLCSTFGLYLFHNADVPARQRLWSLLLFAKLESHLEAGLWNDVFNFAQDALSMPRGTIKVTVLIETILASFEMEEILYELRDHIAGLNAGRWDYIFSIIKKFSNGQTSFCQTAPRSP